VRLDIGSRSGFQPDTLGVFQNLTANSVALVASSNGASIMAAESDGSVMLYNANVDSFTVSRQDFTALSGAYAASNFDQFVVGSNFLNSSLVPTQQFETGTGTPSGFAFVDQFAFRTTVPVASGTTTSFSSAAGVIQRLDLSNSNGNVSRATRMTEAPLVGASGIDASNFSRTLAVLYSRNALVNLSVSGFTVLPWNYDASVAPPSIKAVVNAADYTTALAPGGLISVFGQQLSPVNLATKETPLPTALGDSCLTVNGLAVPMLFVSPGQVNAQMPFETVGNVTMVLHTPGGVSDNFNLQVTPGAPSVFRSGVAGPDTNIPTVLRDKNNQLVTLSNPVHRNDILVIYLTGLGVTTPAVETGSPSPLTPLATALTPPQVSIGNTALPLMYAGLTPNEVGVYQINVRVPPSVPLGLSVPLTIVQSGASTALSVRVVD
jgi:uncharacterized protein (TIGR03437 family)